jgi:hypothetical protein
MPYNYEILENHISAAHPELLDAFVEGWNKLGHISQSYWSQKGFIAPKQKVQCLSWLSWTTVQVDVVYEPRKPVDPFNVPLSKFEKQLSILFHNNMRHAGDLFDFPYMAPLEGREYCSPTGESPSSSERHAIAKDAARVVLRTEIGKVLMKWKKDLDEYGLDSLRRVYLATPQLEEGGEKKFDLEDFELDLDCDSESNISDED